MPLKIALIVLLLIVLYLFITLIRTFLTKAKPVEERKELPYTPEEEAKYAKMLSEMVKVPTVSVDDGGDKSVFTELDNVMKELFPLVYEKLEKTDLDGNVLFYWKGKDSTKEPLLLMGHRDVVPASDEGWSEHGAFSGDIADRKVYGRGAMDCKCTVCAEMAAVEELLEEGFVPERDVYIANSTNEEISGQGSIKTVEYLKNKGVTLAVALDEGGAIVDGILPGMDSLCAAVGVVEKGFADIKFTAKSNGGHSSTPPSDNPLARLAAFINDVEKHNPFKVKMTAPVEVMFMHITPYLSLPVRFAILAVKGIPGLLKVLLAKVSPMSKAFVQTSCVFTMSGGSDAANVIPGEAWVVANIRPSVHQNLDESFEILKKIAAKYDIEAELLKGRDASAVANLKGDEIAYLKKCVNEFYPGYCFTPYLQTGGTDCRNYQTITDSCLRFTPIRMDSAQLAAMHAVDENIGTDGLADGVKFYKYWLKNHD